MEAKDFNPTAQHLLHAIRAIGRLLIQGHERVYADVVSLVLYDAYLQGYKDGIKHIRMEDSKGKTNEDGFI